MLTNEEHGFVSSKKSLGAAPQTIQHLYPQMHLSPREEFVVHT
jgi:hypothetical protein